MADTDRPSPARLDQAARRCVSRPCSEVLRLAELSPALRMPYRSAKTTSRSIHDLSRKGFTGSDFDTSIEAARYRSASSHQTMGCMCAGGKRFDVQTSASVSSLAGLRLLRGRTGRAADPGFGTVRQATPWGECLNRHREGSACARPCHPPPGGGTRLSTVTVSD